MASLQQTLAFLQANNTSQQDVLHRSQVQNENNKKKIDELQKQLHNAESSLRGVQAELAAKILEKENLKKHFQNKHTTFIARLENDIKASEKKLGERLKQQEADNRLLQKKVKKQQIEIEMNLCEKNQNKQIKAQPTYKTVLQRKPEQQKIKIETNLREKALEKKIKQQETFNRMLQRKLEQQQIKIEMNSCKRELEKKRKQQETNYRLLEKKLERQRIQQQKQRQNNQQQLF